MLLSCTAALSGQEAPTLRVTVVPRIFDGPVNVIWEQTLSQDTSPGKGFVVNLGTGNLKVRLMVTPYDAPEAQILLVVQGTVSHVDAGNASVRSSLQSLLVPLGERVVYFPLGRVLSRVGHRMVVELKVDRIPE